MGLSFGSGSRPWSGIILLSDPASRTAHSPDANPPPPPHTHTLLQVLTTGSWPAQNSQAVHCVLPREVEAATDAFRQFYTSAHSGEGQDGRRGDGGGATEEGGGGMTRASSFPMGKGMLPCTHGEGDCWQCGWWQAGRSLPRASRVCVWRAPTHSMA